MALLKSGVLEKLLEDMKNDDQAFEEDRKPVLLQIRSIIPVLGDGDLWPNKGFFLKVSDMSHAIYVSLPTEQNDMILSNKLKLGQFIYVQKLEKSDPVPLIRGLTPIRGRRTCEGSPEDINSPTTLVKFLQALDTADSIVEKVVISEKTIIEDDSADDSGKLCRGLSSDQEGIIRNSNVGLQQRPRGRFRSFSASKARPGEKIIGSHKSRPMSTDDDSDSDSALSSVSSISKRKSWTQSEILGLKEMFDSSVTKNEIKPVARSRSATVSPVRSVRYDSSDENSSSIAHRRCASSTKKLVRSINKSKNPVPKVISEQPSNPVSSLVHDGKGAETAIVWGSLPSKLVKLGKEVVRQRDVALSAAADALQEACAAERLLKSLSTYSEFRVSEGDDLLPYVDRFFNLQDDLAHTKLIMQSLTNISPFKTSETDGNCTASVKEALNIALERKKNAATWIKSAVAFDLSAYSSDTLKSTATPVAKNTNTVKRSSRSVRPKGACIIRKQRINDELPLMVASDKDNQAEWTRGSTLCAATDLATLLQDECRKLFLGYVENYLEEVESKTSSMHSDSQVSAMMYKVKRVNDWLDVFIGKEPNPLGDVYKAFSNLDDSEREVYGRVRNKIYDMLLNHVERTTMAFGKC